MGGIDPLVAAIACESSLSTAILTHGLLLLAGSRFTGGGVGPKKSGGTCENLKHRGLIVVESGHNIHTTVNKSKKWVTSCI